MQVWKSGIYQKTPRMDLDLWYGSETIKGEKEIMIKKELREKGKSEKRIWKRKMGFGGGISVVGKNGRTARKRTGTKKMKIQI